MSKQVPLILGIDPGPTISGWCLLRGTKYLCGDQSYNHEVFRALSVVHGNAFQDVDVIGIEWMENYGQVVGQSIFKTCAWVGRYEAAVGFYDNAAKVKRVQRSHVKLHLCRTARAKDVNVRHALVGLWGDDMKSVKGTKNKKGPLYGIKEHVWSALAVAVTVRDLGAENAPPLIGEETIGDGMKMWEQLI